MINKKRLITLLIPILIISMGVYGKRLFVDNTKASVTTRISFKFDGVDEGLNPHGGSFDAQQIKSLDVVEGVINKLNLDIEPDVLATNIMVRGVVPKDAIDRIIPKTSVSKDIHLEGITGVTYNPTQYDVSLILNKDLKLNKEESKAVLDTLMEVYQDLFIQRYKDTQAIEAAIVPIDPERYDYSEYISLTEGQLNIIKNYLTSKEQVARDFKSPTTNLSFGDLIAQVDLIQEVEVGNVKALVDSFMITRDPEKLSIVSKNMVHRMSLEKEKYEKQAQDLTRAANTYQKDKTVVMGNGSLLPDLNEDKEKEKIYDKLVQQSIEAKIRANRMNSRKQYYEGLLANIEKQQQNGGIEHTRPYLEETEQSIDYIADQMEKIMNNIKVTVDDYYAEEVFKGSITPIIEPRYKSSFRANFIKDSLKIAAMSMLIIVIGVIYVLAKEEFSTKKSTDIKR